MHAGIFWGFVLLTIGTANIVTGGAHPDGPVDPVRRRCSGRLISGDAERRRGDRPRLDRLGVLAAPRDEASAADVQPRRAADPGDDRRRRRDRAARAGRSRSPRYGDDPGRVRRRTRSAVPLRATFAPATLETALRDPVVGAHRARRGVPVLPAVQQAPPHRDRFPNIWFRKLAPRGELPKMDLEDEDATFGLQDAPGPRLEGPARRLHLHRVRPLPGGLPGLEHRQAAQPQDASSWASATCRWTPSTASTSSRTRRSCARRTASTTRRRSRRAAPGRSSTRDPVRRGLGLRDLRRVRRGLPGAHRARRQDRRAAPQPRARGDRASRPS